MSDLHQPSLLDWTPPAPPPIGGESYDPARDGKRLGKQLLAVYSVMKSGAWFTPFELEVACGGNWASLSARLRDIRKPEFFAPCNVERESLGGGLFRYRLVPIRIKPPPDQLS